MEPSAQTRVEQSAGQVWKRVSGDALLLYLLFCSLIVAPALAECQKYGMVLHLHQAITRSVQNGLHKQACPYSVNFSMQIHFGPTLQHKVLLASVYERKLKYSFLRTGTVLDIRKSQLLANYFTKEL